MKQTVNLSDFTYAFKAYDRYDQFGYAALRALFEYCEEYEESTGEEMELDVIALCCDWTAYASAVDACKEYNTIVEDTAEDAEEQCLAWLQEQTSVIEFEGGILVMAF